MLDNRPPARCPKCGDEFGFLYSKPRYISGWANSQKQIEWLDWECHCGYTVRTPTADADIPITTAQLDWMDQHGRK